MADPLKFNSPGEVIAYVKQQGIRIADLKFIDMPGSWQHFSIFDNIRYDQTPNSGYYYVDSIEGQWNTGSADGPNTGYKPRYKEGYFPAAPTDTLQDIRTEAVLKMIDAGIHIEAHHHEVAT